MPQHCDLLRQTVIVIVEPGHRVGPPENIVIKIFGSRYMLFLSLLFCFFGFFSPASLTESCSLWYGQKCSTQQPNMNVRSIS